MQVEFKAGPTLQSPEGAKSEVQVSARERAIAMLTEKAAPSAAPSATPQVQESRQDNTSEAPQNAPADPKAPEEPISSQYAVLARQTKALRAKQIDIQRREDAVKAKEAASNAPAAPPKPPFDESKYISKDKLQQDLFGTLSELGLSYDQIASQASNAPTPEQVALNQQFKALQDKIAALESAQEGTKKSFEQQQADSYKQAVSQIRLEANSLIKNGEAFETIRETNSADDVVDLIEKTFAADGVLLTVEEAAEQVESYLIDEALKIARIKKIQQRLAPQSQSQAQARSQTGVPQQQQLKTLTNQVASNRQLSARERALLAFKGELKK
jgi:hypothetical protein